MNRKVLTVFSILLTLVMAFASALIFNAYLDDMDDASLLIVFALFLLVTLAMIYTIIFDLFIGRKVLIFQKDVIIVVRNGKEVCAIAKSDIVNATFTYDLYNKKRCILSFCHKKKKYYLSITKQNKRTIESFFANVSLSEKDSSIGYFIQHLIEVFS